MYYNYTIQLILANVNLKISWKITDKLHKQNLFKTTVHFFSYK